MGGGNGEGSGDMAQTHAHNGSSLRHSPVL